MKKSKPDKPPLKCWDCLDCPKTGFQETHWSRDPGPHYCQKCGGLLIERPLTPVAKKQPPDKLATLELVFNALTELIGGINNAAEDGDRGRPNRILRIRVADDGSASLGNSAAGLIHFSSPRTIAEHIADQLDDSEWAEAFSNLESDATPEAEQIELLEDI